MNPSAMIYVADGATAQACTTTPAKMTGFATNGHSDAEVGGGLSVAADAANDQLVIRSPGTYQVNFSMSYKAATAGETTQAVLRKGTTELVQCQALKETETAAEAQTMSFSGLVRLTESDFTAGVCNLSVYLETSASMNVTPVHAQLSAVRLD